MKEKFNLKPEFNLGKTSWLGVGGKAEFLFKPKTEKELQEFLLENKMKITILGNTSNLIIRDGGIEGVVIRLGLGFMDFKKLSETEVEVGAGMMDKNFAQLTAEEEIGGFEFLSTIPGNIGGGIKMNCGCFGGEISDILISVSGFDFKGNFKTFHKSEIIFDYRKCNLPDDFIITSARFKGFKKPKAEILKLMSENQEKRNTSQPVGIKTAGSTFKNPAGHKAWELLEKSGMRGVKIGGASFSEKHLNFLLNDGTATAKDLEEIIEVAKEKVWKNCGIKLEAEVKIIGNK